MNCSHAFLPKRSCHVLFIKKRLPNKPYLFHLVLFLLSQTLRLKMLTEACTVRDVAFRFFAAIVYVAPHVSGYLHTDYIYGPSSLQFALLMSDFILLCYLLLLSYCLFIFPSQFRCTCTMTIKTYSLLFQISASDWQH